MKKNSLLVVRKANFKAKQKLICLHHAGGGASSYYTWAKLLGDDIEVAMIQLPGREERIEDKFYDNLKKAVEDITKEVRKYINDSAYSIFGHSMGGILGYEVEKKLESEYNLQAKNCFFSSCKLWGMTDLFKKDIDDLNDDEFLEAISIYGGLENEFLKMEEFKKIYTNIMRHDFKLLGQYKGNDLKPLKSPITFFYGKDDKTLNLEEIQAWKDISYNKCEFIEFPGAHFYLVEHRKELCEKLLEKIKNN